MDVCVLVAMLCVCVVVGMRCVCVCVGRSGIWRCPSLSCEHRCHASPEGGACSCPSGYVVNSNDSRSCAGKYMSTFPPVNHTMSNNACRTYSGRARIKSAQIYSVSVVRVKELSVFSSHINITHFSLTPNDTN